MKLHQFTKAWSLARDINLQYYIIKECLLGHALMLCLQPLWEGGRDHCVASHALTGFAHIIQGTYLAALPILQWRLTSEYCSNSLNCTGKAWTNLSFSPPCRFLSQEIIYKVAIFPIPDGLGYLNSWYLSNLICTRRVSLSLFLLLNFCACYIKKKNPSFKFVWFLFCTISHTWIPDSIIKGGVKACHFIFL